MWSCCRYGIGKDRGFLFLLRRWASLSCAVLFFSLCFWGCSTSSRQYPPEGPAERAGKTLDRGYDSLKRGAVDSYRTSKEWVKRTGKRISQGVSGFREGFSEDPREVENRRYDSPYYRNRDRYDRPEYRAPSERAKEQQDGDSDPQKRPYRDEGARRAPSAIGGDSNDRYQYYQGRPAYPD